MHIWAGNFKSKKSLEKYLDQAKYLKAWNIYDNEPPTGNAKEDAEPDPALRCEFCKEVGLDTYDEDFLIVKYYSKPVEVESIAGDILTDAGALKKLWKKHNLDNINTVIVYEDNQPGIKNASQSGSITYLGKAEKITTGSKGGGAGVHYLWVGEKETMSPEIVRMVADKEKIKGFIKKEIQADASINFYYDNKKGKLDEIIIIQVEDFNIAENMILQVDKMKIPPAANAILDLVADKSIKIDGAKISAALGMAYIGKFAD